MGGEKMALLKVENLSTEYDTLEGTLKAVDDVSFEVKKGEALGVVGESGCGKSTVMKSILQLLPRNGRISSGKILYKNKDITGYNNKQLREIRWKEISMISQGAMNSFNPVYNIGKQLIEVMIVQGNYSEKEARDRAIELFEIVGLDKKRLNDYPHQMSGGMRQRSMIAMSLALDPGLIIADEPTTALDVVMQDRILGKISELQKKMELSMLFVTHDISIIAEVCQRLMVMYSGKIAEISTTHNIFKKPYHPYTMGLINAIPTVVEDIDHLVSIPGYPPNLINVLKGCRFAPRCPFATSKCRVESPEMKLVNENHRAACHYIEKADEFREKSHRTETWEGLLV